MKNYKENNAKKKSIPSYDKLKDDLLKRIQMSSIVFMGLGVVLLLVLLTQKVSIMNLLVIIGSISGDLYGMCLGVLFLVFHVSGKKLNQNTSESIPAEYVDLDEEDLPFIN